MPDIHKYLIINALGAWRDNLSARLIKEIRERGCEILDCRIGMLGDAMTAQLMVSGNWSSVGKLETALPAIGDKLEIELSGLRTRDRSERPDTRPYAVEINAPQQPDLLPALIEFFNNQDTVVAELVCQDYSAGQTGARMVNIQMVVLVPITAQPPALRESFMDTCDELNADGMLDPIKS